MRPKLPSLKRITMMHSLRALLGRGEQQAITAKELASMIGGTSERSVRLGINALLEEGLCVAATVSPPYGFFLVDTKTEYERYDITLKAREYETKARRLLFEAAWRRSQEPIAYQPRLRLETG